MLIQQVCTNGLVTFGPTITAKRGSVPRGYGPPFIAVNWYNFRTYSISNNNKGRVYYRSTTSGICSDKLTVSGLNGAGAVERF